MRILPESQNLEYNFFNEIYSCKKMHYNLKNFEN